MTRKLLLVISLGAALLAGCETNPTMAKLVKDVNSATTPSTTTNQRSSDISVAKVSTQIKVVGNNQELIADKRTESTGLLGKTLTSKSKYNKNYHGELEHFDDYAIFSAVDVKGIPENTNIINLWPIKINRTKEIFAFIKENKKTAYFIDILEVDIPKGYTAEYNRCNVGNIGLFKKSNSDGSYYSKPVKAWTVINGRFNSITNFSKMQCEDMGSGD